MIRVALVGAGGMARRYRQVYARLPGVEWSLAVDRDESVLEACRHEGVKRTSGRLEDALAGDIDVVDISTPNHLHEEQAIAALAAGKHVLLQKPMANTLPAARRIAEAARSSRGVLGMYMYSYTNHYMWSVRQLLERGELGRVQSIRCRDAHPGGRNAAADPDNWRASREKTGGGSFIQLSTHSINLVQWWLRSPIVQVSALCANQCCPNIGGDDVTVAAVAFADGTLGTFDSGYASEGFSREIYGTRGILRLTRWDTHLELLLDHAVEVPGVSYTTPGKQLVLDFTEADLADADNPLNQQRMFLEAVAAGRRPLMGPEEGLRDVAVVMGAYESAATGRTVRIE